MAYVKSSTVKTVHTTWDIATYDVWGNATNGYEVNNTFRGASIELDIPVTVYNVGTQREFVGASPTDKQIREVFGLRRIQLVTDGDDVNIYVNAVRDGYPIGEMICTSHVSLSPIKESEASNG